MTIPNDDAGAEQTFKTSFAARFAKPLSAEDREANLKADLAVNAGVDMLLQDLAPYARLARMRKVALRAGLNMMSFALEKSMARVETGRAQIRSQIAKSRNADREARRRGRAADCAARKRSRPPRAIPEASRPGPRCPDREARQAGSRRAVAGRGLDPRRPARADQNQLKGICRCRETATARRRPSTESRISRGSRSRRRFPSGTRALRSHRRR